MPLAPLWEMWEPDAWDWSGSAYGAAPVPVAPPTVTPFPDTVADTVVELFIDGAWTVVTDDVQNREDIVINRGRPNEANVADASKCTLVLNNANGKYSPRNPQSPYFGKIGRNTPLRVSEQPHLYDVAGRDTFDSFTRTVTDTNWGVSDSGLSWQPAGTAHAAAQYAVNGSAATLAILANNATTGCYLDDASWVDFDLVVTFTAPLATGASIVACGISTHVDIDTLVSGPFLYVKVTTGNAVQLQLFDFVSAQIGTTITTGITHAGSGTPLRVRFRTAGRHLMARVWDPVGAEPTTWQITGEDTRSFDPGSVFVFSGAVSGNTNPKPFTTTYDDFELTAVEPRICAEVAAWPPEWTVGGFYAWVTVETAGILRRLAQGNPPARSPMVRFVLAQTTPPVAYWPLEDGSLATEGAALYGSHPLELFPAAAVAAHQTFGSGGLAPWLTNGAAMHGLDELFGYVDMDPSQLAYCVDWIRAGKESASESTMIIRTGSAQWEIRFNPSTELVKVTNPASVTTSNSVPEAFDGGPHHVRFQANWNSPLIEWTVYVDGASFLTNTYTPPSGTFMSVSWIDFQDLLTHDTDFTMAHIAVWADPSSFGVLLPDLADTVDAAFGHDGEPAATRITRLCAEEGIPLRIPGPFNLDLTTSYNMGVQTTAPALELIRACEATDGGVLFEPRDFIGLVYRMRSQMYSQTPTLELDYTAVGHVAPPLKPLDDDQFTRNDITVERAFGQSARVEQTTGPLSVSSPPDGVGRYDSGKTLSLFTDAATLDQASWRVHHGTVDEARFPRVNANLAWTAAHGLSVLLFAMYRLDVGDRLTIDNPPGMAGGLPVIDQLAQGFEERLTNFQWDIGVNCSPASPWAMAVVEDTGEFGFRAETDGSSLNGNHSSSATSLSVASDSIVWTDSATNPTDFPFDVNIAGVRITVTAITGTTSPQTFTVLRSVDGFDVALSDGAAVSLWRKTYLGL
jgi:hypothetical protein